MKASPQQLNRLVMAIRTCDGQLAARWELLLRFRVGGHPTSDLEHAIAINQLELEILEIRHDELARELTGHAMSERPH